MKLKSVILLLVAVFISSTVLAHSGRTDKDGCHNEKKTGGHHCH